MASAISATGLGRRYGERPALRGVDLELAEGQTLLVLGPNGAGKSTLLRILATLLRPHSGSATVLGHDLKTEGWKLRRQIGLLGHEPLLYRDLSARENLHFHARLHGASTTRIDELLAAVRLSARADDPLHTYSRGMVQRAAAARTVLHDPDLLLLDEPTANLDPQAAELLQPLIGSESGKTRVITSHNPAADLGQADVVLGLRAGQAVLGGPANAVGAQQLSALYADPVAA